MYFPLAPKHETETTNQITACMASEHTHLHFRDPAKLVSM